LTFQSRKTVLSTYSQVLQTPTHSGCPGKNQQVLPWFASSALAAVQVVAMVFPAQLSLLVVVAAAVVVVVLPQ
jgi:hypothetical protein